MSTGYLRSRALPPNRRYNSLLNCLNVEKRTDKESSLARVQLSDALQGLKLFLQLSSLIVHMQL